MFRIRLSDETISEISNALNRASGDWTERGEIIHTGFTTAITLPFLNDAKVTMPTEGFGSGRYKTQELQANVQFVVHSRRYVEQLLSDHYSLLEEIEDWKRKAEDYRDILIQQGRAK